MDARQLAIDFATLPAWAPIPTPPTAEALSLDPTPLSALPDLFGPGPRNDLGTDAPPGADAERVERSLALRLGASRVVWTANRRTVLSSRREPLGLVVRLHRVFASASDEVVEALCVYLKTGERRASSAISRFVDASRETISTSTTARAPRRVSAGAVHDLRTLFDEVAGEQFPGLCEGLEITWGRGAGERRRRRSIRLGTYSKDERLIRVHPALDQTWVPRFFVRFIVFHEMLHHVEPAREGRSRTEFHTKRFRDRERAFHDYERALAWERAHLDRLLRA